MAVVPSKSNTDHRSASTRQTERWGRQSINRVLRLQQMANRSSGDPALHKRVRCRPLCLTPNSSPSKICQLETRPRCNLHRCNDPGLIPSKRLRISTVQFNINSIEQGITGQSRSTICGSSVAGTALVASSSESPNQEPCHDPKLQTSAERPCVSSTNPPNVPQVFI